MVEKAEVAIGKRDAAFCNIKVLLLYLVVYGHLIEARIQDSAVLLWQYRVIYGVHMPLFAFLSGMFLKGEERCLAQMKKAAAYYACFQAAAMVPAWIGGGSASFAVPVWHLWYLLSLCCWAGMGLVLSFLERRSAVIRDAWNKKRKGKTLIMAACVGVACVAGNIQAIGRTFSLSRTIVFWPYVLAGREFPGDIRRKRYRISAALGGILALALLAALGDRMPVELLYQADSYRALGVEDGFWLRLASYIIGAGLGALLLIFMPERRLGVSKVGADTLWIYILHAPLVALIRNVSLEPLEFLVTAPFAALAVIALLYEAGRWKGRLYRIV